MDVLGFSLSHGTMAGVKVRIVIACACYKPAAPSIDAHTAQA